MTTTKIELTPEQITALTTDLTEIPKKAISEIAKLKAENVRLKTALDTLGLALVNHNHQWTDKERTLYEQVTRPAAPEKYVTDGFDNFWPKQCLRCGAPMQIVRPGDCRCSAECYLGKGE